MPLLGTRPLRIVVGARFSASLRNYNDLGTVRASDIASHVFIRANHARPPQAGMLRSSLKVRFGNSDLGLTLSELEIFRP